MATAEGQEAKDYMVIQCWRSKEICVWLVFDSQVHLHATFGSRPFLIVHRRVTH